MAPSLNHRSTQRQPLPLNLGYDNHHKQIAKHDFVPISTQLPTRNQIKIEGSQTSTHDSVTILRVDNITCRQDKLLDDARDYLNLIYNKRELTPSIIEGNVKNHKWNDECKTYIIPRYSKELIDKCRQISKSRIILPKAILEMKERGLESIPSPKILTSVCMNNQRVYLTGTKVEKTENCRKLMQLCGIPVSKGEMSNKPWIISALACSEAAIHAWDIGLFVLSPALIDSLFERSIDDKQDYISTKDFTDMVNRHMLKPFHGVRFSIVGKSSDELELVELMKKNGAIFILQNDKPENVHVILDLGADRNSETFVGTTSTLVRRITRHFVRACVEKRKFLSQDTYLKLFPRLSQNLPDRGFLSPAPPISLCAASKNHSDLEEEFDTKMDVCEPMLLAGPPSMTLQELYDGIYDAVISDNGHLHTQAIPSQIRHLPIRQVRVDPMPELASQRIIWKEKF